jgi:hypothetical protein
MKLLFMGDLQFGRKGKICDLELPNNILKLFNSSDVLFFNLETVVLTTSFDIDKHKLNHKDINIYTHSEDNLKYLKDTITKPIFVSTINNHTFDYNIEGYYNTLQVLDKYNYKFTIEKTYYIDDDFIYVNATDHWTIKESNVNNYIENTKLWDDNCLLIDSYEKEIYTYNLINYLNKIKQNRTLVFSIHWGKNFQSQHNNSTTYLQSRYELFFKNLCNMGVDVVFGHGAHHIINKPYEIYNNKLIIYGLGDYMGDFKYLNEYNTDKNMMVLFDTNDHSVENILLGGNYTPYKNNSEINCKQSFIVS